jgi:hypothetical protein
MAVTESLFLPFCRLIRLQPHLRPTPIIRIQSSDSMTRCKMSGSKFLSDYKAHPERYVAGELPRLSFLSFADGEFDLTLVSYLLFAYQDRLDYEFHRESILEIMRVTRGEARVYPTVTFEAQPSEYIPMLLSDPALQRFAFTEIKTDFEFLVNSNFFLRVTRD